MAHQQALDLMQAKTQSHFDPRVVDAFIRYQKANPDLVLVRKKAAQG
jgi:HD-GYP domain-containing protein (c-di-GMP phosphodiesterase class II)